MAYRTPEPQNHVPADEESPETALAIGDSLGSFVGYMRRSKSSSAGLLAQFFGENGKDADVISALHLTRFLDLPIKVTVWMMKDRHGKVMKKNGAYPKLTEFIATARRPSPNNMGQVAQFFGENGPNADAINILNQSEYLDALVYVEMHKAMAGMTVQDLPTSQPGSDMEKYAHRMTPTEATEFKKLQKRSEEALRQLTLVGFFRQDTVLAVLGRETDYQDWLSTQMCCHPGAAPCDHQPVTAWKIPSARRYGFLPLCLDHESEWEQGTAQMNDGSNLESFANTQSITYQHRWAVYALSKQLRVPAGSIPTPGAVMNWAKDNKLSSLLPNTFTAFVV